MKEELTVDNGQLTVGLLFMSGSYPGTIELVKINLEDEKVDLKFTEDEFSTIKVVPIGHLLAGIEYGLFKEVPRIEVPAEYAESFFKTIFSK